MIAVVSDASVVFQWFRADDEREAAPSAELLRLFGQRAVSLTVLDLTRYEVGNALLVGHVRATAAHVSSILDELARLCPRVAPTHRQMRAAVDLAEEHGLTLYDAVYASVARSRGAELATLDKGLLAVGLGRRPSEIVAMVADG